MSTDVVIVGGGPAGLSLGLCLASHGVKSIILEKEKEITADPRGVVLTGDALRSLWKLGLAKYIPEIGQELSYTKFHDSTFQNKPFMEFRVEEDMMQHAIPSTILQSQPQLELYLRKLVAESSFCEIQTGCEVFDRDQDGFGVTVHYVDPDRNISQINARWLIGADGKRGIVRKEFLEFSAGIRQEPGIFEYEGTWIAANLRINLPTRETHPQLNIWECDIEPQGIYDIFWPPDWHFCRPPGRPTACGRFGPKSSQLWRHEFAFEEWTDDMDVDSVFWEHLKPMITRSLTTREGKKITFTFPRGCIEVLRCRPFRFAHKVVNKWFDQRTALIGDAAHVFPPFGGQGVACGVQDAEGLAWRLAILVEFECLHPASPELSREILQSWAEERRLGVDNSARLTLLNGDLCNKAGTWTKNLQLAVWRSLQGISDALDTWLFPVSVEQLGYKNCSSRAFLPRFGGGFRLAQIYVQTFLPASRTVVVELSDEALRRVPSIMTLLVLNSVSSQQLEILRGIINQSGIPSNILSVESLVNFDLSGGPRLLQNTGTNTLSIPAPLYMLNGYPTGIRAKYRPSQFQQRINDRRARFLIVRPDGIVFAKSRSMEGLRESLQGLSKSFGLTSSKVS